MEKFVSAVGASTLPTFPTVDLAPMIEWVQNGIVSLWTTNAGLIITAGIVMAAMPIVIKKIKGMGKSAMKG